MKTPSERNLSGVEIHLIGFGDQKPACFDQTQRFYLPIEQPITPLLLLQKAGFPDPAGLLLMRQETMIPEHQWEQPLITKGDQITLLSAIEGG